MEANGYIKVNMSQLLLELSLEGEHHGGKVVDEKEIYTKNILAFLIKSSIKRLLQKEALHLYISRLKLIEAIIVLRKYLAAISDENYKKILNASEAEREKFKEQMLELIYAELEKIRKEVNNEIISHEKNISQANIRINHLHNKFNQIIEQHSKQIAESFSDALSNSPANDEIQKIPKDILGKIEIEYVKMKLHDQIELIHLKDMDVEYDNQIQQIDYDIRINQREDILRSVESRIQKDSRQTKSDENRTIINKFNIGIDSQKASTQSPQNTDLLRKKDRLIDLKKNNNAHIIALQDKDEHRYRNLLGKHVGQQQTDRVFAKDSNVSKAIDSALSPVLANIQNEGIEYTAQLHIEKKDVKKSEEKVFELKQVAEDINTNKQKINIKSAAQPSLKRGL